MKTPEEIIKKSTYWHAMNDGVYFRKDIVWKLDREVWAHVPNPSHSEEWSQSKAREESKKLIEEYIGNFDTIKSSNDRYREALEDCIQIIEKSNCLTPLGMETINNYKSMFHPLVKEGETKK
jgi:hypothetical protein